MRWTISGRGDIAAHERAVSTVEFALVLPVFMALMGVGTELSSLLLANMKVQRLATMTADLVAQRGSSESQISEMQIYDVLSALDVAAKPLDMRNDGRIVISAVLGEDTNSDGKADLNRIKWQRFDGALVSQQPLLGCRTTNSIATNIGRTLKPVEPLFHVQVSYRYHPIFLSGLTAGLKIPEVITRTASFRGRGALYKEVLSVEGYAPKTNCTSATGL